MSYQSIYEAWVADPRLAEADRAELKERGTGEDSRVAQARQKAQSVAQPGGR